ncbi:histidine kinase [Megasphaera cerevisiae DSM 20462]|uniref:histidine kinase n=1 Tax=Megasphaera cerevisiae DSM 20462 TaxID=1122219 RepID=A0A0J6WST1_9FIRM|nr:ATP-binding protein [Megasphaera cerevisiae]KMO85544.1 histidine kinase [Megasphaera cerevisiae DSM 20462]SJZ74904.1 two-component system, OmpR family, phosphate regulon sensor histidine kinase PhoR [Megasphaera cerevisiae DSM 20462]
MKRKIYFSFLAMGLVCMIITVLISTWLFWRSMQRQASEEMHVAIGVIASGITDADRPDRYLQGIADAEKGSLRITWINTQGKVLFESDYDKGKMENHLERPEVQEAIRSGQGTAVRESRTLSRALYYTAQRLPDGTILRVSMERESMYAHFLSLLPIVFLLLILAAIGCIKASRLLTASLLTPLRKTAAIMQRIGSPGSEPLQEVPYYVDKELRPLVEKIFDQSRVINETIHSLEQQRNIIRLMMENLQEGVILTDEHYRILGINRCACRILQKDTDGLSGMVLSQELPEARWETITAGRLSDIVTEQKLPLNDRLYQLAVQPVYKDAELYGMLFILDDVTEQEHREQLRREFTSNVSHELKTPLTSISGFAEVLSTGLFQNDADVVHFGSLIRKEAKRLLGLIEEIMHLTHIEEGKNMKVKGPVILKNIINDIVEFMEPVLQEKEVTVHCTMEDVSFIGDMGMIRELAMNLIDNAVKYNRPGGHVYVSVRQEEQHVNLTVRDTGVGIPEDKQKRVFERFYRADTSRSQKINGSGLGLSIVKHIVEHHHGTISLQSKMQDGTTITVRFPKGSSSNSLVEK